MAEPRASSPATYQLRVVLRGVSPLVWRRLLVSSETPLAELHDILQRAFAWSDDHLHRFLIHGTAYGIPRLGGIAFLDDARRVPLSRFRLHRGERFRYENDFTPFYPRHADGNPLLLSSLRLENYFTKMATFCTSYS